MIIVTEEQVGVRFDRFVADAFPELSRNDAQKLIKADEALVNGEPAKASYRLVEGDQISVILPEPVILEVLAEDIPLTIIYEDDDLVVVEKSADMVVHPAYGNRDGTLVNAALHHWPQIQEVGELERAGIVHRLDRGTSGLIVMAKTQAALENLQAQFKERTVYKRYLALVEGMPSTSEGIIDAPIGRDPKQRKKMTVLRDGRPAKTRYDLIEDLETHSLLSVELHTGRTHQIRVHLAWLKHPIVGDRVYGFKKQRIKMKRLFLHAADLHITSPSSGERLEFNSPLPVGLEDILSKLRKNLS